MTEWCFVRHGESIANAEGWLAGHHDAELTQRGQTQALSLREQLKDWKGRVWSSDLRRAADTARLAGFAPVMHPELRERNGGAWEGASMRDLRNDGRMRTMLSWEDAPPGGESQRRLALRVITFLAAQPPSPTLVIAHGGVIRGLIGLLDGHAVEAIGRTRIENAVPIRRAIAPDSWQRILSKI
jgi:2,3-bisphosphoglycerate-dependent phosphoglycerate mutase